MILNFKSRFAAVILAVSCLMTFTMSGCKSYSNKKNKGKISIVATVFSQYDFARQIVGDRADILLLLKPGMEAHSYEPSPKDIIAISQCDVFLSVGGESESWLDTVFESVSNSDMITVAAMDCVSKIEEEHSEGMTAKEEESEDEEEAEYDEHVWSSPVNAIWIVNAIVEAVCQADPKNSEFYRANASEYTSQLYRLDKSFRDIVNNSKRNMLIFGDRFPLLYFVREYGLNYYAAFPGCASETEPSAATVAFLIDKIKSEDIPIVFYIELSNHKVADAVAECTGVKSAKFNTCHNISSDDFEAGESYLSLMTANLDILKEALN